MLVFSPSVHEAISHMRFATSVRILDDRPPPGMHRPSCMPALEWRHIRADVYPADGCMLNHGMTINYDNVHLLHPHKFKHSPKPTELLARNRLSNADASRHWVHGESVDGYAYPLLQSQTKKRKRATIFTDGCELKTVHEIRQSRLQRPSRLRTQAPKNTYNSEPAFCSTYAPEAWYCHDPRLMAREPEGIEKDVPGFVFATPAVSLNDVDKYADSVSEDVMDSLVYALDKLSLDDYVPPVFDEAQAFLEDVFSTMLQLGDSGQANDIPDEPIDIPFYEPTIFNSVDEPHGMDAMPTVIIEISDDESDDGDDSSEEVQADDGNGNGDAGSGEEGDSVDEDDLEGVNYYANLLSSPTPLSRGPTASILASLIRWGIGGG